MPFEKQAGSDGSSREYVAQVDAEIASYLLI